MEVCCTLGMLEKEQAAELKKAGLTAYNHNLDTSREYYPNIITTRTYDERLKTLEFVRDAGINVCSGNALQLCIKFMWIVCRGMASSSMAYFCDVICDIFMYMASLFNYFDGKFIFLLE